MPLGIEEFNSLLSEMDDWLKSALQDLTNYDVTHLNRLFSREQGVEFIQRAIEKGVKISSFFFDLFLFSFESNRLSSNSNVLNEKEIKETFNIEFIQRFASFLTSADRLRDPKNMGHKPCTRFLKELSKSIPTKEFIELSLKEERTVIDALIRIDKVAKSVAEVYFSYSNAVRDFQTKVLILTSNETSNKKFSNARSNVTELKEMIPRNDLGLLVYVVILLKLFHTNLGRLALFTPLRTYSEFFKAIDEVFWELHDELIMSRMDSEFFKSFKGLFYGALTIFAYFPLCHYLGENYQKLKYPANRRDAREKANEFDMTELSENDNYFGMVSTDLRNAFTDIQSWNRFLRQYLVGR